MPSILPRHSPAPQDDLSGPSSETYREFLAERFARAATITGPTQRARCADLAHKLVALCPAGVAAGVGAAADNVVQEHARLELEVENARERVDQDEDYRDADQVHQSNVEWRAANDRLHTYERDHQVELEAADTGCWWASEESSGIKVPRPRPVLRPRCSRGRARGRARRRARRTRPRRPSASTDGDPEGRRAHTAIEGASRVVDVRTDADLDHDRAGLGGVDLGRADASRAGVGAAVDDRVSGGPDRARDRAAAATGRARTIDGTRAAIQHEINFRDRGDLVPTELLDEIAAYENAYPPELLDELTSAALNHVADDGAPLPLDGIERTRAWRGTRHGVQCPSRAGERLP